MKAILTGLFLITVLSITAQAAENTSCYSGQFSISGSGGAVKLQYQIKDSLLHVEVLNPNDVMQTESGGTIIMKDAFKPGPDMKLVPLTGLKCPCEALQTEKGNFTFIVEHMGDGSTIAKMDYFGFRNGEVQAQSCSK